MNGANERGLSALDLALQNHSSAANNELAEAFIQLFGAHIDISCQPAIVDTPRSEIRVIVPGNQQSHERQEPGRLADGGRPALHPLVATLSSGRFHLTNKLIDVAIGCYIRKKEEE